MIDWATVATNIVTSSVAIGVVGFVARSIFTHGIDKDLERYKSELKSKSDFEIERLRNELKIAELEHTVRFSKLHERRADVLAKIYGLMIETEWAAHRYAYGDTRDNDLAIDALDKITALRMEYERNRLYLPESAREKLGQFISKYFSIASALRIFFVGIESPTMKMREDQNAKMLEVVRAFDSEVPAMKFALDSEFRKLLGAKDEANS